MGETSTCDVAIIGAGPSGLFAVFECGMLGLSSHVFDALPEIGGQCTALYPEKPIYDIGGLPAISAGDLIANLEAQAAPFNPVYHLGSQVTHLTEGPDGRFTIANERGDTVNAGAIILAAGAGAFGPNRPPIAALPDFENISVFYACRNTAQFTGKKIVIAGGGDSALDWAIALADIAGKVTLVHRRDKFRGAPASVAALERLVGEGKVELAVPFQLSDILGEDGQITHARLTSMDDEIRDIEADALLCFYGLSHDLSFAHEWGLHLEKKELPVNAATCETSRAGIYAVGDIACYEGKLKLILTGFAEGAIAAHAIYKRLHPETPLHFEYSTTRGLPGAA
jgi:thioredoxin reductase (NADPH)